MSDLDTEVAKAAQRAVQAATDRGGTTLDFSEASLTIVEEILAEAAQYASQMPECTLQTLSEDFGCYILEVARRAHGGAYLWQKEVGEPVLVVGNDESHVAITSWGKVRGRLSGDEADNIPFFYQGFADRVRKSEPGVRVLYR